MAIVNLTREESWYISGASYATLLAGLGGVQLGSYLAVSTIHALAELSELRSNPRWTKLTALEKGLTAGYLLLFANRPAVTLRKVLGASLIIQVSLAAGYMLGTQLERWFG